MTTKERPPDGPLSLPHVRLLRYLGVGLFGVCFALYAVGAYVYLTRG